MTVHVFGSCSVAEVASATAPIAACVSAAREHGSAQLLVYVTGRTDAQEAQAAMSGLLPRLAGVCERLVLDVSDSDDADSDRVVVFTITSVRTTEVDPLLTYISALTSTLPGRTREGAHRVVDHVIVLMSLFKHRGNRTLVAKELRMNRELIGIMIAEILADGTVPPHLIPTRRMPSIVRDKRNNKKKL